MLKQTYPVRGMTCAACARNVENILKITDGVKDANVNYAMHQVQVSLQEGVDFNSLKEATQSIGYDLVEQKDKQAEKKHRQLHLDKAKRKLLIAAIFSLPVFLLSMVFTSVPNSAYIQLALTLPVLFLAGNQFYTSAAKKLMHNQYNMDTLIALGTGSAFLFSVFNTFFPEVLISSGLQPHVYFESAVVIISFILLGNYIEDRAKYATSSAVEELMNLQPEKALRIADGNTEEVPVEAIMTGDLIQVKPGGTIPLDGEITDGASSVNESMLTGESMPLPKKKGDTVIGGTLNIDGSIILKVSRVGEQTTLAQITARVQDALGSKAPAQKLADKISSIFVPIVIVIALVTSLVWFFIGPQPAFINAFATGITVLIIACPCALGLATPTAITVAVGKGAKLGILIRDAQVFDEMHKVETLFVDKTGTLTKGQLSLIHQIVNDEVGNDELELLQQAELRSEHPTAKALASSLPQLQESLAISDFRNYPGNGIEFTHAGNKYTAGKSGWHTSSSSAFKEKAVKLLAQKPATIIEYIKNGNAIAYFALADEIKPEAIRTVSDLQANGVDVVMLTGDNERVAEEVSGVLKLTDFYANTSPQSKADVIETYRQRKKHVAMAGDGVNDAPALAAADVGIAMSTGADVAKATSGITLLNGDVSKILKAINLSKQTAITIKQNLFWAFAYNVVAIPIAAGILYPINGFMLNPMIAGGAMAFSSVTVVLNSLRLKYKLV